MLPEPEQIFLSGGLPGISSVLLSAVFFGSAGLLAGMYIFRHKTKKLKFTITVPLLLFFQLLLIFLCFKFVL